MCLHIACVYVQVFVFDQFACPFGLMGAVHGWQRVGAGITHIARRFLHIPIEQFVDDYFGPERHAVASTYEL